MRLLHNIEHSSKSVAYLLAIMNKEARWSLGRDEPEVSYSLFGKEAFYQFTPQIDIDLGNQYSKNPIVFKSINGVISKLKGSYTVFSQSFKVVDQERNLIDIRDKFNALSEKWESEKTDSDLTYRHRVSIDSELIVHHGDLDEFVKPRGDSDIPTWDDVKKHYVWSDITEFDLFSSEV